MTTATEQSLIISQAEIFQAKRLQDHGAEITFRDDNARNAALPEELGALINQVIKIIANGGTVTLGTLPKELTTTEAARQLDISRPTLMKLINQFQIPSYKVGSHTRLLADDVLAYRKATRDTARQKFIERRAIEEQINFPS